MILTIKSATGAVSPKLCFLEFGAQGTTINVADHTEAGNLTQAMSAAPTTVALPPVDLAPLSTEQR